MRKLDLDIKRIGLTVLGVVRSRYERSRYERRLGVVTLFSFWAPGGPKKKRGSCADFLDIGVNMVLIASKLRLQVQSHKFQGLFFQLSTSPWPLAEK